MKRDADALREVGEVLHGQLWQSPLARDLDVAIRTVQRWSAGEFRIPDGVWGELVALCRKRGHALDRLADKLLKL